MPFSPADIKALITDLDTDAAGFARRLGVTDGTVSRWLSGDRAPTGLYALELERLAAFAALRRSPSGPRPAEIRAIVNRIIAELAPPTDKVLDEYQRGYREGYLAATEAILQTTITTALTGNPATPKQEPHERTTGRPGR